MTELAEFRASKDAFLRAGPHSPLSAEHKARFTGLRYYPGDASLCLRGPLDRNVEHRVIEMDTGRGEVRTCMRAGRFVFALAGQEVAVHLYSYTVGDAERLFLPFRDATSGEETYGTGRFLDVPVRDDGEVEVDFNRAYQPFCSYDNCISCPLPPSENWLTIPVRAGELEYPSDDA